MMKHFEFTKKPMTVASVIGSLDNIALHSNFTNQSDNNTQNSENNNDLFTQLDRFLSAIYSEEEPIHLRAFKPKNTPEALGIFPVTKTITRQEVRLNTRLQNELVELNKVRGLYFVVNSGGQTRSSISKINAFFIENDILSIEEQHKLLDLSPLLPSLRVQTRKSVHAYWLLNGDCSIQEWEQVQLRLISFLGSDAAVKDASRVMRLPGFNHLSYNAGVFDSQRVELVTFEPNRRYTLKQMQQAFAAIDNTTFTSESIAYKLPAQIIRNRNSELMRYAGSLRSKGHEYAEIEASLLRANQEHCLVPLDKVEVLSIASSVMRYEPLPVPGTDKSNFPLTDYGNAQRMILRHGDNLRYCFDWNKWLIYDGKRWKVDSTGEVVRKAKETVRSIYAEAAQVEDDKYRKALSTHARSSESENRIKAMVKLAQSELGIAVNSEKLDADLMLLNCVNGTIDLRTGMLHPHCRKQLITKLVPVNYDAFAVAPTWEFFLNSAMASNKSLISFLQRAFGYSLTGKVSERTLFILYGHGANGKSTFLEAIRDVLNDYAMRTPTETLMPKNDGTVPNDVARLKGARFVSASETDEGKRFAEARIKDLTGGDTISARFMRAEWFEFKPEFKIWISTNHKPTIKGTDPAIWDRIKLIPFNVRVSPEKQDKKLAEKLRAELSGILAWAVCGCLEWQRLGLGVPDEVRAATESYREEMDTFAQFITESCQISQTAKESSSVLYNAYSVWCTANGEKAVSKKAFGMRLHDKGYEPTKIGNERGWKGLKLLESHNQNSPFITV